MVIKNMPGLQRDWARKVRGQARCSSNSELDESVLTCGVHSGTNLSSLKGRGIVSPDFIFPHRKKRSSQLTLSGSRYLLYLKPGKGTYWQSGKAPVPPRQAQPPVRTKDDAERIQENSFRLRGNEVGRHYIAFND